MTCFKICFTKSTTVTTMKVSRAKNEKVVSGTNCVSVNSSTQQFALPEDGRLIPQKRIEVRILVKCISHKVYVVGYCTHCDSWLYLDNT